MIPNGPGCYGPRRRVPHRPVLVLEIACTVVYFCHFVIPVGVGMVLWLVDRVQFLRYTVALLAMSFAGFVVFLILPVAPPWLAGHHHLLTGVHSLIALPSAVSPIYNRLDPDVAAAFPSLHAAYPLLAALALWPVARRGAVAAASTAGTDAPQGRCRPRTPGVTR